MWTQPLLALEHLTRTLDGKLTITIDRGVPSATFRPRGRALDKVCDYAVGPVDDILRVLYKRLTFEDLPDNDLFIRKMNPAQVARWRAILADLRALKNEVLNPIPVEVLEPALQSPRSSLHPQRITDAGVQEL